MFLRICLNVFQKRKQQKEQEQELGQKLYLEDFSIGTFAQSSNSFEFVDPHISV
jgi:hypothetical protein